MICKNCGIEVAEGAKFCQYCGSKVEEFDTPKLCTGCGAEIKEDNNFCPKCGKNIIEKNDSANPQTTSNQTSSKTVVSIFLSVVSAVICLISRLSMQDEHVYYGNIVDVDRVMGLDGDTKPYLTFIPAIAAVIAILMFVNNNVDDKRKKTNALIVSSIFIVLSLLFIWFDIPMGW